MPYTVFTNNNNSITAPNESGEIILDTSISRQIRIEVSRNSYRVYDILEKKYLSASEIEDINPRMCHFTAIVSPYIRETPTPIANEENYPILHKFVYSCLGSTFSVYPIASFETYYSNNIYFTNNPNLTNPITIEFEFQLGVKIRLNLSPKSFKITSDNVEIISLFQHNITINASRTYSGTTNTKYLYSLSFSLINNRYNQYTKDQISSMINDLPQNTIYPASGLIYRGRYANGASTMSITVYTIRNIYTNANNSGLFMKLLLADKNSGSSSSTTVDNIAIICEPSLVDSLSFTDDVIQLS